jgi:hypothetical protein
MISNDIVRIQNFDPYGKQVPGALSLEPYIDLFRLNFARISTTCEF